MFYSEVLADFIANLDFDKIPMEVKIRAKELMLDSVGCALAANNESVIKNAIDSLSALDSIDINSGAGGSGIKESAKAQNARIWFSKQALSPVSCAMINGIAAHALDFDDTHTEAILHASAILTPLCLTYGASVNNNGADILKAFIAGWEVASRVGIASKGSFHKRGFHTTAIAGIFGSAASCCILLKLSKDEIINALGIAASFASGINEFLSNGSNSKVLHIANAIKNGILVARLAKSKMTGPISVFEGRDNVFKCFGIEDLSDKAALIRDLNHIWQVMQVSIKPYPCCHFAHGFIDCALSLRRDDRILPSDILQIHCYVDEVPISFICDPIESKRLPKSAYEAKFSLPYLISLALFDGDIHIQSFKNLHRKELLDFCKNITYQSRQSSGFPKYFPGHMQVTLNNGAIMHKDVPINKGNFDNPLTHEELKNKFLQNAKEADLKSSPIAQGANNWEDVFYKIMNLESNPNL